MADEKGDKAPLGGARGASDPMEALKMIVNENTGLKLRVLKAIKSHLALKDQTIFDVAKDKKDKKKNKNDKKDEKK
jgi:hypothetical protein